MARTTSEFLAEPSHHIARLVALIKLLCSESLSAPAIVERLSEHYAPGESGTRRVRADVQQLRALGFEIDQAYNPHCYVMAYNPLAAALDDELIDALATLRDGFDRKHPLHDTLAQLIRLLTVGLDNEQRTRFEQPALLRLALTTAVNYAAARPLFRKIQYAIHHDRQVHFAYYSLDRRDQPLTHIVDPYGVEYYQQQIYLVGYSNRTQQITDFRLDQIAVPSFHTLPTPRQRDRDLYPYCFRYRLSAKLARRGISERFVDQQVVQQFEDGSVEIAARARSQFYAVRGLLRYAENARATFPPELVAEMRATLDAMRVLYDE